MQSRTRRTLAAALAAGVLAAACSSSGPSSQPTTTPPASGSTAAPVAPETFSGSVDDFYRVPKPLPSAEPGTLIRVQPITLLANSPYTSLRIMYHSRDAKQHDRAVTGVITYPKKSAPAGGWPVVATAHGTTGIISKCAPSRVITQAPSIGVEGVSVATDYIGLGPVGEIHPYLSGLDEGQSVLDSVRAARNLRAAHAGTDYVIWGHSQGGHAALWAHQLSATYAPELHLKGTVALAPAAELTKTYGPVDRIVANIVSLMALYGAAPGNPEIDPDDYVGPQVEKLAKVVTSECLDTITSTFVPVSAATFYAHRPQDTQPARAMIIENDPGHTKVDVPLLILQGDQDIRVAPERTDDLFARECKTGQVTEYHVYPGKDHDTVVGAGMPLSAGWLTDRLQGKPATDSCDDGKPVIEATGSTGE